MKKLIVSVMACFMFAVTVQAVNPAVDTTITLADVGTTNTIPNIRIDEWCSLGSIHIAFPPVSTCTVSFYAVAGNGATEWQIGDTMTYANDTEATVSQSYYPKKATNFINADASTNIVLTAYPVKGTIKYIFTKTGAASQSIKPVLLLTK
jgi:hypothetical protein